MKVSTTSTAIIGREKMEKFKVRSLVHGAHPQIRVCALSLGQKATGKVDVPSSDMLFEVWKTGFQN